MDFLPELFSFLAGLATGFVLKVSIDTRRNRTIQTRNVAGGDIAGGDINKR